MIPPLSYDGGVVAEVSKERLQELIQRYDNGFLSVPDGVIEALRELASLRSRYATLWEASMALFALQPTDESLIRPMYWTVLQKLRAALAASKGESP